MTPIVWPSRRRTRKSSAIAARPGHDRIDVHRRAGGRRADQRVSQGAWHFERPQCAQHQSAFRSRLASLKPADPLSADADVRGKGGLVEVEHSTALPHGAPRSLTDEQSWQTCCQHSLTPTTVRVRLHFGLFAFDDIKLCYRTRTLAFPLSQTARSRASESPSSPHRRRSSGSSVAAAWGAETVRDRCSRHAATRTAAFSRIAA